MKRQHLRFNIVGAGVVVLLALVVAAGLVASAVWSPFASSSVSQASSDLSVVKTCSDAYGRPAANVGALIIYKYTIENQGLETLSRVSVVDDVEGPVGGFSASLEPGEKETVQVLRQVQESDWTPEQPLVNEVTAKYETAGGTEVTATDTCQLDILHLTAVKKASLSDGLATFEYTVTNDGSTPLSRSSVYDSEFGDITYAFPGALAVGQTETVTLTKPRSPGDPPCNNVEITYHYVVDGSLLAVKGLARACIEERGSVTLTKFKEAGPFTKPLEVCFRLEVKTNGFVPSPDPPEGAEQCKVPDADGNATFTWTNLTPGDYQIVETNEVCEVEVEGEVVVEDPCTRYAMLDPIPFTMPDPPEAIVIPAPGQKIENLLQPGEICFEKRNPDGSLWLGGQGDVTFKVTGVTDPSYPEQVHYIASEGNPICKPVPEGTYKICETPPPDHTVSPSECQTVDALGGQLATVTVTFVNTPEDGGEGCTPGYWKQEQHLESWGPTGYNPNDSFVDVFGVDLGFETLWDAVNAKGGGVKKLARHGTAALLGAAHPGVAYPFTVAEVIAAVQAGDADALAKANELGCPLD